MSSYPQNPHFDPKAYREAREAKLDAQGAKEETVYWTAKGLKFTRVRFISDRGFPAWDLSYAHGEIDGRPVRVSVPFVQLRKGHVNEDILRCAKEDGVFAKGTGIFDGALDFFQG